MKPALLGLFALLQDDGAEEHVYLRRGPAKECALSIRKSDAGWSIESSTFRGKTKLVVTARYDKDDAPIQAEASLAAGDDQKKVKVTVQQGRASVLREGAEPQHFDAPRGLIVTSAPDWTDTFLLCRRYDRSRGGRQEFAGLWIHPAQPAQRLTFAAERLGVEKLQSGEQALEVDRLSIVLRGNSRYLAWADASGRMLKLLSLPVQAGGTELVREGSERWTWMLTPE